MSDQRLRILIIIMLTCFISISTFGVISRAAGQTITTYPIFTDVTPGSFSIVWTVDKSAICNAEVYEDNQGLIPVTCTVDAENSAHPPAEDLGVMKALVSNLPDGIRTFYVSTETIFKATGQTMVYPAQGEPLLEVTLEDQYLPLVANDNIYQYLYDPNGQPAQGTLLVAEVDGGGYPITGWAKSSGRAIICMGNFYSVSNHKTMELQGGEQLTLTGLGGGLCTSETNQPIPQNTGLGSYFAADPREVILICIPPDPHIEDISPTSVRSGALLTISGSNFGATRDTSQVLFGETEATNYQSWGDMNIKVYVPSMCPTYCNADVKVKIGTKESNSKSLTIDNENPTVSINSPSDGVTIFKNQTQIENIKGAAADQGSSVARVEVRIDAGTWQTVAGTTSWSYNWNISMISEGSHTISARAIDQLNHIGPVVSHTVNISDIDDLCEDSNGIVFVSKTATGAGNGCSWQDAFTTIQAGINKAALQTQKEIWVAQGTYDENIVLKEDVSLYGGFNGSETSRDQRQYGSNITIIDGGWQGITVIGADNAMIDGFTITRGYGEWGGGIYCPEDTNFSIYNNRIHHNTATVSGAGIYISVHSMARIIGNTIQENEALYGGGIFADTTLSCQIRKNIIANNTAKYKDANQTEGGWGGGVCFNDSSAEVIGNTIQNNEAIWGGGIFVDPNSAPIIESNIIKGNMAKVEGDRGDGGGIFLYQTGSNDASARIHKNLFKNNQAGCGGAIFIRGGSGIGISNNIFTGNKAMNNGGAISCTEGANARFVNNTYYMNNATINGACFAIGDSYTNVEIINSIIWDPLITDPIFLDTISNASYSVIYTDTYGWDEPGAGNINIDPGFRDPNGDDFHLEPDSPCIDVGDPDPQYNDIDGSRNDMGAYGGADPICLECFSAAIRVTGQESGNAIRISEVTIGIDKVAQTKSAPPPPPTYTVYMRLMDRDIPDTYYGKDIRIDGKTEEIWALRVEINNDYADPNLGGYYPLLSWDPHTFSPVGTFSLWSEESGTPASLLVGDMRQTGRYQIKEEDGEYFYIIWSCSIQIEMDMPEGWSMISLPVLTGSVLVSDLFPEAEVVYGFDPYWGYYEAEELKEGEGYWILHNQAHSYQLWGQSITNYSREVQNGWYMIGGCSAVSKASVDIGGIEVVYGFDNKYGYFEAQPDNLKPTEGYWIALKDIVGTANLNVNPTGSTLSRRMKARDKGWHVSILATGQEVANAVRISQVTIGIADTAMRKSPPPLPPSHSVRLRIKDLAQDKYYGKDVRQAGSNKYVWVVRVDINDEFAEPGPSDYYPTLSWYPQSIDPGHMRLVLGATETGLVLVEDMSRMGSYQTKAGDGEYTTGVDSNPATLYYTIIFIPFVNKLPVSDEGSDQANMDASTETNAHVTLDGAGFYSLNVNSLTYAWSWADRSGTSIQTGLPLGQYPNSHLGFSSYSYVASYLGLMQFGIGGFVYQPFNYGVWINPLTDYCFGAPFYLSGIGFSCPAIDQLF